MNLTFRQFDASDADFKLLFEVFNSHEPNSWSEAELRDWHKSFAEDAFHVREFVIAEDTVIGTISCSQDMHSDDQATFDLGVRIIGTGGGKGLEGLLLQRLTEMARSSGAALLSLSTSDAHCDLIKAAADQGFALIQSSYFSQLRTEDFEYARYQPLIEKLEASGTSFETACTLVDGRDEKLEELMALVNEIWDDVSQPDPFTFWNIDQTRMSVARSAEKMPGCFLVASTDGKMAGVCAAAVGIPNPESCQMVLTGTARSSRRKGLATALKAKLVANMKDAGIRFVLSENEKNNPMFRINEELGFQKLHEHQIYRLRLRAITAEPV